MQVNGSGWLLPILEWASALFVGLVGLLILAIVVLYVLDITQYMTRTVCYIFTDGCQHHFSGCAFDQ